MHVLFSSSLFADEKHRQYHEQEETAEMIAARIDRDVVSERPQMRLLHVCEVLQFTLGEDFSPQGKFSSGEKISKQPLVVLVDLK